MLPPPAMHPQLAHPCLKEIGDLLSALFGPERVGWGGRPERQAVDCWVDCKMAARLIVSKQQGHLFFNRLPSCPSVASSSHPEFSFIRRHYTNRKEPPTGFFQRHEVDSGPAYSAVPKVPGAGIFPLPPQLPFSSVEPSSRAKAPARRSATRSPL